MRTALASYQRLHGSEITNSFPILMVAWSPGISVALDLLHHDQLLLMTSWRRRHGDNGVSSFLEHPISIGHSSFFSFHNLLGVPMARQDLAWPMNFQGLEQHLPLSVLSQGLLPRHDVAKPVSTMYEENRRSKGFREQYDTYRNALPLSALCKCVHTHTHTTLAEAFTGISRKTFSLWSCGLLFLVRSYI